MGARVRSAAGRAAALGALAASAGVRGAAAKMAGAAGAGGRNVLGGALELCSTAPRTGFYRDGFCCTGPQDFGRHVVCASVTADFLEYTREQGNDLSSPSPQYGFPGLRPGDRWCLCASRWAEALRAGKAPKVHLSACHEKALEVVSLEDLQAHAVDTGAGSVDL